MGLEFKVSPAVLIPRPDTEILVETALARLEKAESPSILDLGAGSGAIICSLLAKLPRARGVAVDISPEALAVAAKNASSLGVADRLKLELGDLFTPVEGLSFDAVVSNPPYIHSREISGLAPEVLCEPRGALDGGADGLDFYRKITGRAADFLAAGGFAALEVGKGQAPAVADLALQGASLQTDAIIKDYAGIERVVVLKRRN